MQQESIRRVRNKLTHASAIAVLTGAGISADSGVPTFRGADGLWRNFRAEDLATPEAFARDPRVVWEWYDWRRQLVAGAQPNPGHLALVELEQHVPSFTRRVFTAISASRTVMSNAHVSGSMTAS